MKGEYNNIEDPHENHHHHHNHPFFTKYAPLKTNAMVGAGDQSRISDPIPISSKKPKITTITTPNDDGATVEVTRRPRGRPPGSKNKPKPPIVINREPEPSMSPYILEVQSGSDIIPSLTRFTRRRGMGICVLNASGSVANITLKQPATTSNHTSGGTVTFHGRFDILSLSAVLLTDTVPFLSNNNEGFGFSITLGGPQGQIFGGKVVEPLIAVTTVYVIATSFNCHNYQRLPGVADEGERVMENISGGGGGGGGDGHSGSPVSGCGSGGHYGCHVGPSGGGVGVGVGADVMWGPTSRTPLPPY